jgi:hypothetical protein
MDNLRVNIAYDSLPPETRSRNLTKIYDEIFRSPPGTAKHPCRVYPATLSLTRTDAGTCRRVPRRAQVLQSEDVRVGAIALAPAGIVSTIPGYDTKIIRSAQEIAPHTTHDPNPARSRARPGGTPAAGGPGRRGARGGAGTALIRAVSCRRGAGYVTQRDAP